MRTVFTSNVSFEDAARKAQSQGFRVVGQARNPNGQFVVFAEQQQQQSFLYRNPLKGKI